MILRVPVICIRTPLGSVLQRTRTDEAGGITSRLNMFNEVELVGKYKSMVRGSRVESWVHITSGADAGLPAEAVLYKSG